MNKLSFPSNSSVIHFNKYQQQKEPKRQKEICIFCGNDILIYNFKNQPVCFNCLIKIHKSYLDCHLNNL